MIMLEYLMEMLGHTDVNTTRELCKQFKIAIDNAYGIEMVDLEDIFKLPQFQNVQNNEE